MTKSIETTTQHTESGQLPYWLVNVPPDQWPAECPSYLRNLPAKSIKILSTPDDEYVHQDWRLVQQLIESNRIDLFQRVPSDLRKYLEYTSKIVSKYGSVMDFVVRERLHWENSMTPKGSRPFENPVSMPRHGSRSLDDHKILYNDWPYGVEKDIIHLVVWTKFTFEDDPMLDDLTPRAREEIDGFVESVFRSRVPPEHVIWFRNWKSLKSVHAVEHFHVMMYRPDMGFVREVTNGDVPLVDRT